MVSCVLFINTNVGCNSSTIFQQYKRRLIPLRMKQKNRDKIFIAFRSILKLLLVHSFIVIYVAVGGYIVFDLFVSKKQDTSFLTYYGFAVFAVFANICFSYTRTIENEDTQSYLRGLGERFLFSATGFLIGSLLNYVNLNWIKFFNKLPFSSILLNVSEFIGGLFFVASFFFAAITIHSLLNHLFEKIMLNKDNYYDEK